MQVVQGVSGLALSIIGFVIVLLLVVIESHLYKLREQQEQTEILRRPAWRSAYEYEREFDV